MNCSECGKENVEIARFCEMCGTSLTEDNAQDVLLSNSQPSTDDQKDPPGISHVSIKCEECGEVSVKKLEQYENFHILCLCCNEEKVV